MRLGLAVIAAVAVLAAGGCGSDSEPESRTEVTDEPQSADTVSAPTESEVETGPGPNEATPDAPSQTADSKALREHLREVGRQAGASWADSIDQDETVLSQEGAAAAITVNGAPSQADLQEICEAAKAYRTGPAFVTVSNQDGSVSADC